MGKPLPNAAIARLILRGSGVVAASSAQDLLGLLLLDCVGIRGDLAQVILIYWSLGSLGEEVQYQVANAQNLRQ